MPSPYSPTAAQPQSTLQTQHRTCALLLAQLAPARHAEDACRCALIQGGLVHGLAVSPPARDTAIVHQLLRVMPACAHLPQLHNAGERTSEQLLLAALPQLLQLASPAAQPPTCAGRRRSCRDRWSACPGRRSHTGGGLRCAQAPGAAAWSRGGRGWRRTPHPWRARTAAAQEVAAKEVVAAGAGARRG